jgi:hypothetical protein
MVPFCIIFAFRCGFMWAPVKGLNSHTSRHFSRHSVIIHEHATENLHTFRRTLIASGITVCVATISASQASATSRPRTIRSTGYFVTPTNPPMMQPLSERTQKHTIEVLAKCPAVIIGDHGNIEDHLLVARLLEQFSDACRSSKRGIVMTLSSAIGNERTQRALDEFTTRLQVNDAIALEDLRINSDWATEDSVATALPILLTARRLNSANMRLVAIGLEANIINAVRSNGLESIGVGTQNYVKDPPGFMTSVSAPGFKPYSDSVISGLYENYVASGGKGSLVNFFAARILEDEVLSQRSYDAAKMFPGALLLVLTSLDHVKFGFGCHARLERIAKVSLDSKDANDKVSNIIASL